MTKGASQAMNRLVRVMNHTLIFVFFGCSQGATNSKRIEVEQVKLPEQTTAPGGAVVSPDCIQISDQISKRTIQEKSAQISFSMESVKDASEIDFATFDISGQRVFSKRLCASSPASALLELPPQAQRIDVVARNRTTGDILSLENIAVMPGSRLNFGKVKTFKGSAFMGSVESDHAASMVGQIEELGWNFAVDTNGTWSSGALPPGQWSITLSDSAGRRARFSKMVLGSVDVKIENFSLKEQKNTFSPLWSGVLKKTTATFMAHAEQDASEMRVGIDQSFQNAFWMPFRQIVSVPILASGKQRLFAQYRSASGTESAIMVSEFTAQILNLDNIATAIIAESTINVEKPETTISTTPPPGAVEHSVTVDAENLPRTWVSVDTPLEIKMQPNATSCGRRSVYVKFRDAQGSESDSLRRTINVRCWERNLPQSILEARYESGAVALTLGEGTNLPNDAVLIWGGRNREQLFNDGAILSKIGNQWTWEKLPEPPDELTPRTKPQLVVGKNHILFWGGEDLAGNAAPGWAFYNFRTKSWVTQSASSNLFSGTLPPTLKNASVAFVSQLNGQNIQGSFLVIGGEETNSDPQSRISNKLYMLLEDEMGLIKQWTQKQIQQPIARATFGKSAHRELVYLYSGITTPSGAATTSKPDASGTAPELSGDVQTFGYYYDPTTQEYKLVNYLYRSTDSRTGALEAHAFLHTRPSSNTSPTLAELLESQVICVYGGQPYATVLPNVCVSEPFCRRLDDGYFFAPMGRLGLCFQPQGTVNRQTTVGYLKNYYLPMSSAPQARRLAPRSAVGISSLNQNSGLFFWSGLAGGEFLSGGSIYYSSADKWIPITELEAPAPRQHHTTLYIEGHKRILIWGGLTAQGPTADGAFYVLP
jgi:hypothetical protein